jgi:hypothetical protein
MTPTTLHRANPHPLPIGARVQPPVAAPAAAPRDLSRDTGRRPRPVCECPEWCPIDHDNA